MKGLREIVIPILANGDPIGSVTVLPPEGRVLSELEIKTAELGAGLLWRSRWKAESVQT